MCSQVSNTMVNCLWTDDSGRVASHNITILGMFLYSTSNQGNYSANGIINWETGDEWTKQSKIFFSVPVKI